LPGFFIKRVSNDTFFVFNVEVRGMKKIEYVIREEREEDYNKVKELIKETFKENKYSDQKESELVDSLRGKEEFIKELSLVVEFEGKIIGYILLTKLKLENVKGKIDSLALLPVCIDPNFQGMTIGSNLIEYAINKARELGHRSIIVIGSNKYFSRFGFVYAGLYNIKPPFCDLDEHFMALQLTPHSLLNMDPLNVLYSDLFLRSTLLLNNL
jgi:predicted N-acetyltransferase YhbS